MYRDPKKLIYSMSALIDLGHEVTSSEKDFRRNIRSVLLLVMGAFPTEKGAVFMYGKEQRKLSAVARKGFDGLNRTMGMDPEEVRQYKNKPVRLTGNGKVASLSTKYRKLSSAGAELFVPLWAKGAFMGGIALGGKYTREPYSAEDLDLLRVMANQVAIKIHDHMLFTDLSEKLEENRRLYDEMRLIYHDTIQAFAAAIDAKDIYTKNHSYRVARYVVAIAKELGWSEDDIEGIYIAGLMHDVGKIVISDQLLNKQAPFTTEEIQEIKRHPALSYNILSKIRFPWKDIVHTIRHHHERLDGKGYPDAITDSGLSEGAKILTIADSFDAMTQDRPYRKRMDLQVALTEMKRCLGTQFDPKIIAAFCRVLEKEIKGELPEPDILPHLGNDFDPAAITSMLEGIMAELQD